LDQVLFGLEAHAECFLEVLYLLRNRRFAGRDLVSGCRGGLGARPPAGASAGDGAEPGAPCRALGGVVIRDFADQGAGRCAAEKAAGGGSATYLLRSFEVRLCLSLVRISLLREVERIAAGVRSEEHTSE